MQFNKIGRNKKTFTYPNIRSDFHIRIACTSFFALKRSIRKFFSGDAAGPRRDLEDTGRKFPRRRRAVLVINRHRLSSRNWNPDMPRQINSMGF